jgi:hypothetical protein
MMDAVTSGLVVSTAVTAAGAVNSSHARQHSPSAAAYSAVQTAARSAVQRIQGIAVDAHERASIGRLSTG